MGRGSWCNIVSWPGELDCSHQVMQELESHQVPFAEPGAGIASPVVAGTQNARDSEKVAQGGTCAQSAWAVYRKQTNWQQ